MSTKVLQNAFQKAGYSQKESMLLTQTVLGSIKAELANSGHFNLKGLGVLEVVANNRKQSKTQIGGRYIKRLPVRVRFRLSRQLRREMVAAYANSCEEA